MVLLAVVALRAQDLSGYGTATTGKLLCFAAEIFAADLLTLRFRAGQMFESRFLRQVVALSLVVGRPMPKFIDFALWRS